MPSIAQVLVWEIVGLAGGTLAGALLIMGATENPRF